MKSDNSIPFSRSDLVGHLSAFFPEGKQRASFLRLATLVEDHYHRKFHEDLGRWKASYAVLDPDRTSRPIPGVSPQATGAEAGTVIEGVRKALVSANYREISRERLQEAFAKNSPWGLQLKVELGDYEDLALYSRGEYPESSVKKTFLLKRRFDYSVFRQVVLVFKLRDDPQGLRQARHRSSGKYRSDRVYLKLFKSVPTVDLEMLFPDADIKIRPLDKLKVILPLAAGLASSLYKIVGYVLGHGSALGLLGQIGFWALVGGLFGVALKGFFSYRTTVEKYLKSLTESLYFQNLDNNSGVFTYLMDEAEEEECKEVLLGYAFLATRAGQGMGEAELDRAVESHFRESLGTEVDFEVADALVKLRDLGLVVSTGQGLGALALPEAVAYLTRS